jgi:hypothetical protein
VFYDTLSALTLKGLAPRNDSPDKKDNLEDSRGESYLMIII